MARRGSDIGAEIDAEGNGARQVLDSKDGPVRSVVVGIVDDVY
jgi:microcompartment protein CcmK/EutM